MDRFPPVRILAAMALMTLVDLNQYLLYPLPARVPIAWFAAGLLEFCLAGWFAARVLGTARRGVHAGASGAAVA